MSTQLSVRRGWRYFRCGECDHWWSLPSRDAMSPSGETCPQCGEFVHPCTWVIDETLPCNSMGNLIEK